MNALQRWIPVVTGAVCVVLSAGCIQNRASLDSRLKPTVKTTRLHREAACQSVPAADVSFSTVFQLNGTTGNRCEQPLVKGTGGWFYGTTELGGQNGGGAIFGFKLSANTVPILLHSFPYGSYPVGGLMFADNKLYGVTSARNLGSDIPGQVFEFTPSTRGFRTLHTFPVGTGPTGVILGPWNSLFVTTQFGGDNKVGTILRMGRSSGKVFWPYSFEKLSAQREPVGRLLRHNGFLYGTGYGGGGGGVFRIGEDGRNFTPLVEFDSQSGGSPYTGIITGGDGFFYGATYEYGPGGAGAIYRFPIKQPHPTKLMKAEVLFTFDDKHCGGYPMGDLLRVGSAIYGTALRGGENGRGVVFRITKGKHYELVHLFTSKDGNSPRAALIHGGNNMLYGTTAANSVGGGGTVYAIKLNRESRR